MMCRRLFACKEGENWLCATASEVCFFSRQSKVYSLWILPSFLPIISLYLPRPFYKYKHAFINLCSSKQSHFSSMMKTMVLVWRALLMLILERLKNFWRTITMMSTKINTISLLFYLHFHVKKLLLLNNSLIWCFFTVCSLVFLSITVHLVPIELFIIHKHG